MRDKRLKEGKRTRKKGIPEGKKGGKFRGAAFSFDGCTREEISNRVREEEEECGISGGPMSNAEQTSLRGTTYTPLPLPSSHPSISQSNKRGGHVITASMKDTKEYKE